MQNKGNLEKRRLLKLNFDDELRDLQNGEMRYALNCRVGNSDNDNQGDIENVKGNVLVSYTLPAGTNKCIGAKEDLVRKRVFYFVWNSNGDHRILMYSEPNNSISTILENNNTQNPLNFDPNYLITGINIVENLLYWTDDLNEPMKIDVEKALNNDYPSPFLVDYIYAIKPPQPCEPTVNYASDTSKNTNFLKQKLFQFKARYVYDNGEKSVPSPISIVALPTGGCTPQTSTDNNIVVEVETGNAIVKEIEIFAREVSDITLSQATDFYTITILNKAELGIGDNTTYQYAFYNDKNYIALDTVRSNQLQDFIPLKAKAQELVDGNRLVYGNIEEGFDPVDVKAKLQVNFEDNVKLDTLTIKGRIFIGNPFAEDYSCGFSQAIHNNGGAVNNGPCFGGFDDKSGLTGNVLATDVGSSLQQTIPLAGFVVYLAGTNYYGVSKQNVPSGFAVTDLPVGSGVYNAVVSSQVNNIINAIKAYPSGAQVYSTFSISGITEGSYIMRLASHNTTINDLGSGIDYQRTSTYTNIVGGKQGHEVALEFIIVNGAYQVLYDGIDVSNIIQNGILDLNLIPNQQNLQYNGDTWVLDLSIPKNNIGATDVFGTSDTAVLTGYVCDKDIVPQPSGTAVLNDTRIHLALVKLYEYPTSIYNIKVPFTVMGYNSFVTRDWGNATTYTDHNGYFFIAMWENFIPNSWRADIYTGKNLTALIGGDTFWDSSGAPQTSFDTSTNGIKSYIIQNTSPSSGATSVQQYGRTIVKGYIADNNTQPVKDFNVQITRGGSGKTNSNGEFSIYAYGNKVLSALGNTRRDFACFSITGNNCYGQLNVYSRLVDFQLPPYNAIPTSGTYYILSSAPTPTTVLTYKNLPSVSLKRGATYDYGIVYYDHGLRNGTTQTKDYFYNDNTHNYGLKLYVPFYTDKFSGTSTIVDSGKPVINWAIANTPPSWATHYQWVRTKRGSISFYLQWTLQSVEYVTSTGTPASFTAAADVKLTLNSITGLQTQGYKARNKNSILDYQFVEGDRIRFIKNASGAYYPEYYDVEIKGIAAVTTPLVLIIPNSTGQTQLQPGDLIEIYRPIFGNISVEEDIFYEIGECYEIGNAGLSTRYHKQGKDTQTTITIPNYKHQDQDTSKKWQFTSVNFDSNNNVVLTNSLGVPHSYAVNDQIVIENNGAYLPGLSTSGVVTQINNNNLQIVTSIQYDASFANSTGTVYFPATGIFYTGDTYYKMRNIPYSIGGGVNSTDLAWWQIEDQNFSDFWVSSYYSIGRPNKVDKQFKQIRRPTTIYYTGQFIPETNINDLNNVLDTSFETYERAYGSIQRFYNIDRMLDCYQELKVGRIPISQQIWKDAGGSAVPALSDNVLNKIVYYNGEFGIGKNPESLAVYGYRRYFLDANRGVFLRLSNDGITPISEHNFKAHNFFTDECKTLTALGVPFHVYTVYDQKFTEVVVAFEDVFDRTEQKYTGKTLSFNEDENTWATFYSYKPDYMVSNDTDIITFNAGRLWKHNENTVYNNFYGFQYPSKVHFPVNGLPSKEKVFQAISFEDADPWDVVARCPNGMQTFLNVADFDFEQIRNMQYADFKNDINTPNTWNQANFNALIDGQKMQDYVMLVELTSNQTTFQKLYAVNVLWTPVERSNK